MRSSRRSARSATSRSRPRARSARAAGRRSGASPCPSIRWAVIYGVILTTARCLGEYGAVAVVSGRLQGQTETATLRVQERWESFDLAGAYAISIVLATDRDPRPRRHDRHPTQGGSALDVDPRPQRLQAVRRLRRRRRRLARGRERVADRAARPERLREVDAAADHRRARDAGRGPDPPVGQRRDRTQAAEAERRLRLPALRRLQAHDRPREHRVRPEGAEAPEVRDQASASTSC